MKFRLPNLKQKEKVEIPNLNRRQRRAFSKSWKTFLILGTFGFLLFITFLTIGTLKVASWFDTYSLSAQNPIRFAVRQPFVITRRFPDTTIPKATYIEVSPLTTPQQIVDAAKQGTIPQYADDGGITPVSRDVVRMLIKNKVIEMWGATAWPQIDYVITHESNYNPYIINKGSGACGIFQALPCSKLPSMDVTDQINWGMNYIKARYGTPANAKAHEITDNWY